ncbi:hypothetical protein AK812_SmicGene11830 [Symbiodinium microadriaticum]|uniref:Uncharacterized protein n=1 Tax=Symbiodinium microadriaticum TaxID=2951 RepID=A0A1Q9ECI2_SYMMI|nr:hypothetical protein AK812_SmicGene11830 [Symbiodinium microadriaticum]
MASAPASGRHFRCAGLRCAGGLQVLVGCRWQHDAAELTLKFLRGIGLFGGRWEAFMHGLTDAPEMLVLQLGRYRDGLKLHTRIQIEDTFAVVRLPLRDGGHNGLFADGEMAVEGAEKWQFYKRVDGRGKGNTGGGDQLDGRRGHSHKRFAQLRSAGFGRVREMAMGMAMGNGGAAGLMAMGIEAMAHLAKFGWLADGGNLGVHRESMAEEMRGDNLVLLLQTGLRGEDRVARSTLANAVAN